MADSGTPTLSLPRIDWRKVEQMKQAGNLVRKVEPLDPLAITRRLAPFRETPLRVRRGTFRCPVDATDAQYTRIRNDAIKAFLAAMSKQGWELRSRIKVDQSRFEARTLTENPQDAKPMPGFIEYVVRAIFEQLHFKTVRIEVPGT